VALTVQWLTQAIPPPQLGFPWYWFHLQKKNIANFHVLGLFIPKKSDALVGRV
jgi:hypothetical protein